MVWFFRCAAVTGVVDEMRCWFESLGTRAISSSSLHERSTSMGSMDGGEFLHTYASADWMDGLLLNVDVDEPDTSERSVG